MLFITLFLSSLALADDLLDEEEEAKELRARISATMEAAERAEGAAEPLPLVAPPLSPVRQTTIREERREARSGQTTMVYDLDGNTLQWIVPVNAGGVPVTAPLIGANPMFVITPKANSHRESTVYCDFTQGRRNTINIWTTWGNFLLDAAENLRRGYQPWHAEPVKKGFQSFAGSQAVGFCQGYGSTGGPGSRLYLSVTRNRACFGNAGCNTDKVAITFDADQAKTAGRMFLSVAAAMKKRRPLVIDTESSL